MAFNKNSSSPVSNNGGKCPEGVKFVPYSNPHGDGAPMGYDDTMNGIDGDIKDTMKELKRAFKPRRP